MNCGHKGHHGGQHRGHHHSGHHDCGCGGQGHHHSGHRDCGCGGQGHFERRFQTREEKIARLARYLENLEKEAQAVQERIAEIKGE